MSFSEASSRFDSVRRRKTEGEGRKILCSACIIMCFIKDAKVLCNEMEKKGRRRRPSLLCLTMINKASQGKRGRNGDGGRVKKFFLAACCPPSPSYTNIWIPKRDNEDENDENVKYDNWNEKIIHEIFRLFKLFSSVFRRHSIKYSNALHENSLSPLAMLSCRGWWWLMEEFPGAILGIILDHRWR